MTEQDKMLSTREAAAFIGMSEAYLRMSRCEGHRGNRTPGPAFYRCGRVIRYKVADLERWREERRCEIEVAEAV